MREQNNQTNTFQWKNWIAGLLALIGFSILFAEWEGAKVYWPYIVPALLLISGVVASVDYLLHANYRTLFMGVLFCLFSLFIWINLFLFPVSVFWKNEFWFGYMFFSLGVAFLLFILESGGREFNWIPYICFGIMIVQWLIQGIASGISWISYLAGGFILAGLILILITRKHLKKE